MLSAATLFALLLTGCNTDVDRPADDDDCIGQECDSPSPEGTTALPVVSSSGAAVEIDGARFMDGQFVLDNEVTYGIEVPGEEALPCDITGFGDYALIDIHHSEEWAETFDQPVTETYEVRTDEPLVIQVDEGEWDGVELDCYIVMDDVEHHEWTGEIESAEAGEAIDGMYARCCSSSTDSSSAATRPSPGTSS